MKQFRIWKYVISHSRLLIRAQMNDQDPDDSNIDIVFSGVYFLYAPDLSASMMLDSWDVKSFVITHSEAQHLQGLSLEAIDAEKVFVLRGEDNLKWYIGAGNMFVDVNQMYALDTPIDTL